MSYEIDPSLSSPQSDQAGYDDIIAWFAGIHEIIFSEAEFEPLREYLKTPRENLKSYLEWALAFDPLMSRCFWCDPDRDLAVRAIKKYTEQNLNAGRNNFDLDEKARRNIRELSENGHCSLPLFPATEIAAMREYFETHPVHSTDKKSVVSFRDPALGNMATYPTRTVVNCPHLLEYASSPRLLAIIENYLGAPPTAMTCTAWWSFAGKPAPQDAQLFHFDYADYRFCNLFIYLTDVDMQSGPHCYVERTHTLYHLKSIMDEKFPENPGPFLNWFWKKFRKTDDEVEAFTGRIPKYFTGSAGTVFLADTRGIHKGLLPVRQDRLLAQITYSVSPRIQEALDRVPLASPEASNIPERLRTKPFDYTFRLLVQQ